METYDVIIIGAGPAGMMAAITAAQSGDKVLLLEKNEVVGRKVLATGNGRCNLTNLRATSDRYHGANPHFIQNIINLFDQNQTIHFFESQGIALKEEDNGRIFPRSNQASTIVEALKHLLEKNDVALKTSTNIKSIENGEGFVIKSESGGSFTAQKLIVATGGRASFPLGSTGDGIYWAGKLGHTIVPVFAALVPIETKEEWVREVQGIKVEAHITTKVNGKVLKESDGDCLFTHFGLSGPAVMAHAGEISPLVENQPININLDIYPESTELELDSKLEQLFRNNGKRDIKNSLQGLFPAKLVPVLLREAKIETHKNAAEVSKAERGKLVDVIKHLSLTVKKVRPLKEAQVSRGGVDTTEVNPKTLESKVVPGLFFCGEVLDVDGDSGGFNLQWAWSSGFVAGQLK